VQIFQIIKINAILRLSVAHFQTLEANFRIGFYVDYFEWYLRFVLVLFVQRHGAVRVQAVETFVKVSREQLEIALQDVILGFA
jgi:hypothetical protein